MTQVVVARKEIFPRGDFPHVGKVHLALEAGSSIALAFPITAVRGMGLGRFVRFSEPGIGRVQVALGGRVGAVLVIGLPQG